MPNCILHFSSKYLAIFGVVGVCFNPIKGLVLLKTARNFKDTDNFETYSIDVEKKRNQILWYIHKIETNSILCNSQYFWKWTKTNPMKSLIYHKSDCNMHIWQFVEISNGETFLTNHKEYFDRTIFLRMWKKALLSFQRCRSVLKAKPRAGGTWGVKGDIGSPNFFRPDVNKTFFLKANSE